MVLACPARHTPPGAPTAAAPRRGRSAGSTNAPAHDNDEDELRAPRACGECNHRVHARRPVVRVVCDESSSDSSDDEDGAGTTRRKRVRLELPLDETYSSDAENVASSPPPARVVGPLEAAEALAAEARAALCRAPAGTLDVTGREREREQVLRFVCEHAATGTGGALYVSGCPGAGKTLLVSTVLAQLGEERALAGLQHLQVNCMAVGNAREIYTVLLEGLVGQTAVSDARAAEQLHEHLLSPQTPLCLVVLDEMDQLMTRDQEVLYHIFELASVEGSRLLLVGIANALDLTDRLLPRLRAKNVVPQLLHFPPYTHGELVAVLQARLALLPVERRVLFDADALQLCARKVAANSGDTRKALDVCRLALDAALRKHLQRLEAGTASPSLRVGLTDVAAVLSSVFGSPYVEKMRQLQTHAKIVLHMIAGVQANRAAAADLSAAKVYDLYSGACRARNLISSVSRNECLDLLSMLESGGLITLRHGRDDRLRKVTLSVPVDEVRLALRDDQLLLRIVS